MSFAIREHACVGADHSVLVRHESLPPGAAVEVIILLEPTPAANTDGSYSFLDRAQQLRIDAPADYSTSYEEHITPRP